MIDIIIVNKEMKCVSMTIWKMLETEGGVRIPEILQNNRNDDEVPLKVSISEYNNGVKDPTLFYYKDRIRNLIKRENKGLPNTESVIAVRSGTAFVGKIISNEDIISI